MFLLLTIYTKKLTIFVCLRFAFCREYIGTRRQERGAKTYEFFGRRVWAGGRRPKQRMRLLIFMGCKGMENPNFWGRDWHPVRHLGIFFFLTSVFIFCNLSPLLMWLVEAIFWKMWTFISVQTGSKQKTGHGVQWIIMTSMANLLKSSFLLESFACRPVLELLQFLHKIYSKLWWLSSGFMWYLGQSCVKNCKFCTNGMMSVY